MVVPEKPAGSTYFLLLRTDPTSALSSALGGGLPPLRFEGTRCICCNRDASGSTLAVPLVSPHHRAEPIPAPVCEACRRHALAGPGGLWFGAGIIAASIALVAWFGLGSGYVPLLFGGALAALGVFITVVAWRARPDAAGADHAPGLQVQMSRGQLAIHTRNRALAEDIARRFESHVVKAT